MPKARKDHKCSLCGEIIIKGSEYHYKRIPPWDGGDICFFTFKAHNECYRVWCIVGEHYDYFPDDYYEWKKELEEHKITASP